MTEYEKGFMDKCAEFGINADTLVKSAFGLALHGIANNVGTSYIGDVARRGRGYVRDYVGNKMRTAWNNSGPGKAVNNTYGKFHNAVGKARGYLENIGERIGNDYADYRQRTDVPSEEQKVMAMRQQLGYNNRALSNYRRAAGVPHTPTRIQPAPTPPRGVCPVSLPILGPGGGVGRMLSR